MGTSPSDRATPQDLGTSSPKIKIVGTMKAMAIPRPMFPKRVRARLVATTEAATFTISLPIRMVRSNLLGLSRSLTTGPMREGSVSQSFLSRTRPKEKKAASEEEKKAEARIRTPRRRIWRRVNLFNL